LDESESAVVAVRVIEAVEASFGELGDVGQVAVRYAQLDAAPFDECPIDQGHGVPVTTAPVELSRFQWVAVMTSGSGLRTMTRGMGVRV
jgi:hypothetical protein